MHWNTEHCNIKARRLHIEARQLNIEARQYGNKMLHLSDGQQAEEDLPLELILTLFPSSTHGPSLSHTACQSPKQPITSLSISSSLSPPSPITLPFPCHSHTQLVTLSHSLSIYHTACHPLTLTHLHECGQVVQRGGHSRMPCPQHQPPHLQGLQGDSKEMGGDS